MKVYFKFKPSAKPTPRSAALKLLRESGAKRVERLFPGTPDPDLTSHYVAESESPAAAKRLLRLLKARKEIAFAHGDVKRRPM